jgi:6-phosphogluconate dehydrogenase
MRIWGGGCIIRADFLNDIASHYTTQMPNLMMIPLFTNLMGAKIETWGKVATSSALAAISLPLFGSILNYFDADAKERLPADVFR